MQEKEMIEKIKGFEAKIDRMIEMVDRMPCSLSSALELHAKWLRKEEGGVQLDLSAHDLSGANLSGTNLTGTDLRHTNLKDARLDATVAKALASQTIKSHREERGDQSPRGRG
jgi:hypothetical protein